MNLWRRSFIKRSMAALALGPLLGRTPSYGTALENGKFVDVDGIRTRYFEGGSGEAMVLVHGGHFGSDISAIAWTPIFNHLARHFHVYAVDKLGQGHTGNPQSDADYAMQATIRHVYRFIQTLGIRKVHLVGNSRGALPVTRITADHPEMVQSLVLFNSRTLAPDDPSLRSRTAPPAAPEPTRKSIQESSSRSAYNKDYITEEYVQARLRIARLPKIKEAKERLNLLTSQWVEHNQESVRENPLLRSIWWYRDAKNETLDLVQAGGLKTPTLIVWGFNDRSAPHTLGISLYKTISAVVDRADLHFVNRCGHRAFAEYPEEVTRLMVDFIKPTGT